MKHLAFHFAVMMMAAVALAACERQEPEADGGDQGVLTVTFSAQQWDESRIVPFGCEDGETSGAKTRGDITANDRQMTDLWVLDYMDGELQQQIHQTNDQQDFAEPTLPLRYGEHTLYFVASRGTEPTLSTDDRTVTWAKTSDTFWTAASLTVSPQTATAQSVTLQRVATKLQVKVLDAIPDGATSLTITPEHWYYGLDYTTGSPTADRRQERTVSIPASYVGTVGSLKMEIFGLCSEDGFETDLTVSAADADAAPLGSVAIADVPLHRNRMTLYQGSLFSGATRDVRPAFTISDAWDDDYVATW